MNLVIKHGDELATTSEIVASNTGNDHASVIKLVRSYKDKIEQFGSLGFEIQVGRSDGRGGQSREVAILNEQQATFLLTLMRNSEIVVRFKVKLVKEFYRMRNQAPVIHAIPQTLSEALRLAADLSEQKEQLAAQLTIAAPKADAFERIADADGCLGLQAAGKVLQQKPNKFIAWLREQGWIYRRAGSMINLGRAEKVNAGYITHKVTTVERSDGTEKVVEQTLITPKGLTKLALMLNVNTLPKAA